MKGRMLLAVLAVSTLGISSIQNYEGFSEITYKDVGGIPTIGYGSTEGVKLGDRIDEKGATRRLIHELDTKYHNGINRCIRVPLNQSEYDAYISLTYNIGINAFCKSTLVKKLNQLDYVGACKEILRFNKVKKKVKEIEIINGVEQEVWVTKAVPVKGLTNRRQSEYKLCLTQ